MNRDMEADESVFLEESYQADNTSADLTSMESVSLDQSSSIGGDSQVRKLPLRTSRRRVQKNTAVVLNADRLRRFEESMEESFVSNQSKSPSFEMHSEGVSLLGNASEAATALPRDVENLRAYAVICAWWRALRRTRRGFNNHGSVGSPEYGLSTIPEEEAQPPSLALPEIRNKDRLFGLLLGHRVRRIMQLAEIKSIVSEHRDVRTVFCDLVGTRMGPTLTPDATIELWIQNRKAQSITASQVLSGVEHSLASSLIKQLLAERGRFLGEVFRNSEWCPWPRPGYWKLDYASRLRRGAAKVSAAFHSPPRAGQKAVQETPPHVRMALQQRPKVPVKLFVSRNTSKLIDEDSFDDSHATGELAAFLPAKMPKPLKEVMEARAPSRGEQERTLAASTAPVVVEPALRPRALLARASAADVSTSASVRSSRRPTTGSAPTSTKRREQEGGHIQLDILSGDRLMPARKGAVAKDSNIEPDRKPCLRISLLLPSAKPGASMASSAPGAGGGMKRAFHAARDFEVLTLHPSWDCTVNVPLPFLKSCLRAQPDSRDAALSQDEYERVCRALLEHWCAGCLLVEVVDGERFNEDIFMGQVKILLTSFMPLIKKVDELEVKGVFQLDKAKPTDRVSGSVRLHAYLHVPTKAYVEEQWAQLRQSGGVEISRRRGTATAAVSAATPSTFAGAGIVRASSRSCRTPDSDALKGAADESPPAVKTLHNSRPQTPTSMERPPARESVSKIAFASKFMQEIAASIEQINMDLNGLDGSLAGLKMEESENIALPARGLGHAKSRAASAPSPRQGQRKQLEQHEGAESAAAAAAAAAEVVVVDQSKMAKIKAGRASKTMSRTSTRATPPHSAQASSSPPATVPAVSAPSPAPSPAPVLASGHVRTPAQVDTPFASAPSSSRQARSQASPPTTAALESRRSSVGVSKSSLVGRETAHESRQVKRNFLSDMARQLDGLSAIQHSADAALNNFNQMLAAKMQKAGRPTTVASPSPGPQRAESDADSNADSDPGAVAPDPDDPDEDQDLDHNILLNYSAATARREFSSPVPASSASNPSTGSRSAGQRDRGEPDDERAFVTPLAQGRAMLGSPIARELERFDRPQMGDESEDDERYDSSDFDDAQEDNRGGYHSDDYAEELLGEVRSPQRVILGEDPFDSFDTDRASALADRLESVDDGDESDGDELRVIGGPGVPGWRPPPPPPRSQPPPPIACREQGQEHADEGEVEEEMARPSPPRWKKRVVPRATLVLDDLDL